MVPKAGLDGCGKSRPSPGFDPRIVQAVAIRYTDCAIPAPKGSGRGLNEATSRQPPGGTTENHN